jgi:hypothetical protein
VRGPCVTSLAGPPCAALDDGLADVAGVVGEAELGSGVAPSLELLGPLGVTEELAAFGTEGDEHAASASAAIDASTARRLISVPACWLWTSSVTRIAWSPDESTVAIPDEHHGRAWEC